MKHARTPAGRHRAPAGLALVARRLARRRDSWEPLVRFDPVRRWFTLLDETADHQAWLLTWLPGQSTHLHDHGDSAGAFTVASGVLTEQTVDSTRSGLSLPTTVRGGRVRSFGPEYVHRLSNQGSSPAISIHVYAPAQQFMRRFALDPVVGLVEVYRERAGVDW